MLGDGKVRGKKPNMVIGTENVMKGIHIGKQVVVHG